MGTLKLICTFGEREQWLTILQQHLAVCDAALGMYPVGVAFLMTSCHVVFTSCHDFLPRGGGGGGWVGQAHVHKILHSKVDQRKLGNNDEQKPISARSLSENQQEGR